MRDLFCSPDRHFKDILDKLDCFAVTTVNFINDTVFIFCSHSIFQFTKQFTQTAFSVKSAFFFCEIWLHAVVFEEYFQRKLILYSFWSLLLGYLGLVFVVVAETSCDYDKNILVDLRISLGKTFMFLDLKVIENVL